MLFDRLLALFSGSRSAGHPSEPHRSLGMGYYLESDQVSNGMGGYRPINVCLRKTDDPTFRRIIVDANGIIRGFPGFREGAWRQDMQFPVDHRVRFAFRISPFCDGHAAVSWTLQPDGRYFEDEDGFGAENCEEVILVSYLNTDGKFSEPFYQLEEV